MFSDQADVLPGCKWNKTTKGIITVQKIVEEDFDIFV
jgi:hypothetical protein